MMNLPPFGPLTTAGMPVESTIVVVGAPALASAALALGIVLIAILCVVALRVRRRRRHGRPARRVSGPQVAMPYAPAGQAR